MRKLIYFLCFGLLLTACDDGDIITTSLEFGNTFKTCGDLVFYKTKTDPAESLSIFIGDASLTIDDIIATEFTDASSVFVNLVSPSISVTLNGGTNRINYRSYSALPTMPFCSDVPSSELNITNDAVGSGIAVITTVLTEDDNDGIPAELEDINGNGNLDDDDTDGDGVPNYLDDDDDGDNVKTSEEGVTYTEADGLTAQNTDLDLPNGDMIPDYLDNDDDGDDTPTREERNIFPEGHNPGDNSTNGTIADYLNPDVSESTEETVYRSHIIQQKFTIEITINMLSIPQLMQETLYFGTLNDTSITSDSRTVVTIFN